MGVDSIFRLCSYVKCKKSFKNQVKGYRTCLNKKCIEKDAEVYGSSYNFCCVCGKKMSIKERIISSIPSIEPYEIFKDNSLFPIAEINKEYDYFISNKQDTKEFISNKQDTKEPMSPVINGRYSYPEEISIESDLPEKHLIWFENKYKKQIQKLKEIYGKENVEVKYGITFEVF